MIDYRIKDCPNVVKLIRKRRKGERKNTKLSVIAYYPDPDAAIKLLID